MEEPPRIPKALHELIRAARRELKLVGVDERSDKKVLVEIGWKEISDVYTLSCDVLHARRSRDEWRRKATSRGYASLESTPRESPATLSLLLDVERILSGAEDSPRAMHSVLARVREEIKRRRRG